MFMAQQYISVENQTLLWKTINRSPQLANNTIAINREQWFSNIIKQFYEQIKSPKMSIAELRELNQKTIAYMVNDLKRIETLYMPTKPTPPINSSYETPTASRSLTFENPQTRMSMYNDQFSSRQKEYENMLKPPAPPIANFGEKVEDEAITNMDELLQQQIKQREYDVAQVRPPPPLELNMGEPAKSISTSSPILSPSSGPSPVNMEMMTAIQELTKQLAELRDEVRLLKENTAVKTVKQQMEMLEEPGVGI